GRRSVVAAHERETGLSARVAERGPGAESRDALAEAARRDALLPGAREMHPREHEQTEEGAEREGELEPRRIGSILLLAAPAPPAVHSSPVGSSEPPAGLPPSSSSSVGSGGGSAPGAGAAEGAVVVPVEAPIAVGGRTEPSGCGASSASSWSAIDFEWSRSQYFFGSEPVAKASRSLFFLGQFGPNSRPVCESIVANWMPGGTGKSRLGMSLSTKLMISVHHGRTVVPPVQSLRPSEEKSSY